MQADSHSLYSYSMHQTVCKDALAPILHTSMSLPLRYPSYPCLLPVEHHLITSCTPSILSVSFSLNIIPETTPSRPHLGLYPLYPPLTSITIPISRRQTPNSHNVPTPRGAPYTAAQPTKAAATTISTLGGWPSRLRPAFRSHHLGHLEPNARFKHLPPFASFQ